VTTLTYNGNRVEGDWTEKQRLFAEKNVELPTAEWLTSVRLEQALAGSRLRDVADVALRTLVRHVTSPGSPEDKAEVGAIIGTLRKAIS
jgi:hypothetical protein